MRSVLRRTLLGLALAFTSFQGVQAADQDFTLINRTGYDIDQVYVSPSRSNNWGRDVMGQDVLANGAATEIVFPPGTQDCNWDLKVVYSDQETATWQRLNLCNISRVTIRYNRGSGETSATVE